MKSPVRPVFSVVVLTACLLTIGYCLINRQAGLSTLELEPNLVMHQQPARVFNSTVEPNLVVHQPAQVFNSTLLQFASVDIGEAAFKQDIEQLLEGNFTILGRYRTFAAWQIFNNLNGRARPVRGIPEMLRSPEFYRYWLQFRKVLNSWAHTKSFKDDILSDLVDLVKKPIDEFKGSVRSNARYASCAVVGNSGILLQKEYGELIDGHEVVIRLNNARTGGFERNVGKRTDISFVNSNILNVCGRRKGCFCHPYGENVPIVMYICQAVHLLDYTLCNPSHKPPLIVTDPRFDVLCSRIVKYYSLKLFAAKTGKSLDEWSAAHEGPLFHYSSGMQAIMLAVGICEKVSVFGFGKTPSVQHHYHTNQKAELTLHDYEAEYELYHDLVNNPRAIPFITDQLKFPPVVIYL